MLRKAVAATAGIAFVLALQAPVQDDAPRTGADGPPPTPAAATASGPVSLAFSSAAQPLSTGVTPGVQVLTPEEAAAVHATGCVGCIASVAGASLTTVSAIWVSGGAALAVWLASKGLSLASIIDSCSTC